MIYSIHEKTLPFASFKNSLFPLAPKELLHALGVAKKKKKIPFHSILNPTLGTHPNKGLTETRMGPCTGGSLQLYLGPGES